MSEKETDRTAIIEKAREHPTGLITKAHPSTLHAMQRDGLVYKTGLGDWLLTDAAFDDK